MIVCGDGVRKCGNTEDFLDDESTIPFFLLAFGVSDCDGDLWRMAFLWMEYGWSLSGIASEMAEKLFSMCTSSLLNPLYPCLIEHKLRSKLDRYEVPRYESNSYNLTPD